jgi:hypothetical protein
MGREGEQRRLLILPHEAAAAVNVGAEYGGELYYPPLITVIISPQCEIAIER